MKKTVCMVMIALFSATTFAQSGFGKLFGNRIGGGNGGGPTTVDSATIEMNNKENIVIFKGNVIVKSPQMDINCERMELHMKMSVINGKNKRDLKEIRCFKNIDGDELSESKEDKRVIIIRKFPDAELSEEREQRSISGKAIYNLITGKIVLTDKPVMVQGINEIHGSKITVWRDSEVMDVIDGRVRYIDDGNETLKSPF